MSYDFNRVFTEGFTDTSGGTVTATNSNIRVLHGLFGPKLQTSGPVKLFVTVKGGFANFRFDPTPASFSTFTSSVNNLRADNVNAALYPGGGVEAFLGPIGLRAEVGDEIIFVNGAHHNCLIGGLRSVRNSVFKKGNFASTETRGLEIFARRPKGDASLVSEVRRSGGPAGKSDDRLLAAFACHRLSDQAPYRVAPPASKVFPVCQRRLLVSNIP